MSDSVKTTLWQEQSKHFDIKIRLAYLAAGVAAFLIAYLAGALGVQLSQEEATSISTDFLERIQGIEGGGIFSNNAVVGLGMFIPAAGAILGVYTAFTTGIVFNAFAVVTPSLAGVSPLSVLATPFGILELLAYGLAMSRSGMLTADLIRKKPLRQYLIVTLIEIAIAIGALVIGALIEGYSIDQQQ
jgi:stage II sporulation SpoM-like protein